ncbi:HlyD family secretion protein [Hydrocarboniphaga sp.]|uniref:HlyD family secretion protein n=1 Tax=Hydrocarboniphaga sp. TaxID=2033016 RepID=UPI002AB80C26|nr:efflux RND transporter periplasmic adaptor subunit [Hydrocarboniphaga sp.]MDZ4077218.1 efflux RND transporter periplasmic adaptor subunit [Hydrocarboniphaga sp.]
MAADVNGAGTPPHANPGEHPYWLADVAAARDRRSLPALTRKLAEVFDGSTPPARRPLAAKKNLGIDTDAAALREAALDLAIAGLLAPGIEEPLPSPGQLERDPWGRDLHRQRRAAVPMPSLLPGTLARPGLPGALAGNFRGRHRGAVDEVDLELSPGFFAALGRPFALGTIRPAIAWTLLALVICGLFAFWRVRFEIARDVARLLVDWPKLLIVLAVSAFTVNLVSQSARLVSVRRTTGEWPSFGLVFGLGFIPRFFTHTGGPAELADARGRTRILVAPLTAMLLLAVLAQLGWFLTRQGSSVLPQFFVGLTTAAIAVFLFDANPLARRDGYHWFSDRIGVTDLREQAWMSLAGQSRPWNERPLPDKRLRIGYAALTIVYLITVMTLYVLFPAHWLEHRYGGVGVLVFLSTLSFSLYRYARRGLYLRTSLEPFRVKLPTFSRTTWIIIGVIAVLMLLPYPYEPSGKAVILPRDRAEVRALVPGDVREVLVEEGQMVTAGQDLLRISDVAAKAKVAASEATLKRAEAELTIVKSGGASNEVQLARERLATARKRLALAQTEAERIGNAFRRRAVSPQDYDTARGTAEVRRQEVAEAEQQVKVIGNPARDERIAALQAEVVKAETELEYNREQLANTTLKAPIAGRVVSDKLLFARGAYLETGAPVAYIEDTSQLQAELEMPESTIAELAPNAAGWVRVWAYPGSSFKGHVVSIAPDAEQGEYGKIVRVRMVIDEPAGQLKPEMTGQGKVRSHWTLAGLAFTRALVRFVLVEVWSWLP